jgi:Cu/Ag efflux pump CusA
VALAPVSTSFILSLRFIQASRELRSIPGVRNFGAHIGRAEVADEVVGPEFTELWISLDQAMDRITPAVDYAPTVAKIQEVVDGYPGLYRGLLTYSSVWACSKARTLPALSFSSCSALL